MSLTTPTTTQQVTAQKPQVQQKTEYKSILRRYRTEYLERHKDFSSHAVKSNFLSVRKLFRWVKIHQWNTDKEDFVHYNEEGKLDYIQITREDVSRLNRKDVYRYFLHLRDTGLKKSTAVQHLAAFRHFQTWTCSEEWLDMRDPVYLDGKIVDVVSRMSNKTDPGRTLDYHEVQQLLDDVHNVRFNPLKKKALILLMVKTGLRRGEVVQVQMKDFNWDNQTIHVADRKNEHQTDVLFDDEVERVLRQYLDTRSDTRTADTYLFTHSGGKPYKPGSLTTLIERLDNEVSVCLKGPHDFRHTFSNHYSFQVAGTVSGRDAFLDIQMAHRETGTRRHYQTQHRRTDATLSQRRRDYEKAVPQYLGGDGSLEQFL